MLLFVQRKRQNHTLFFITYELLRCPGAQVAEDDVRRAGLQQTHPGAQLGQGLGGRP